ncbi:histidine kinase [Algoriphagus zhangzhouensis]|uniref:GAF domain-containing protein n=1 Tax=Algoriphagus zhangzhouensis TaxID=1073327 RepID=A0A1M7Z3N6_9BACT|nr:sensor histidine kinase [Algoriphagus zhangzhouensis]TDY48489.1 GAF domain-containing protein [Algoriphagus zhangzhouensis]SHO59537.1 GAF domain-containing protein [Algoriphagus zhangzhouensis]
MLQRGNLPEALMELRLNKSIVKSIQASEIEEILLHFSKSMVTIDSEEELLWDMVKNCISILDFEDAVIYLMDESGEFLVQKAAIGPKSPDGKELINAMKIPLGSGVTGKVAQTGLPIVINDTRLEPDYIQDDEFRLSELAVPILLEGKVIGVIDSENSKEGYFTDQHLRILHAVASIYAGQIARLRAEQKAKKEQFERWKVQQRIYRMQMEAISAQLSPHFVFNSLNAIQHYILLEDKRKSLRFLSIFGKLLRYFLGQIHQETVLVRDEIQMLDWYLQLQKLRYEEKFVYDIEEHRVDALPNSKIPAVVVQSLIENLLEEHINQSQGNLRIKALFSIKEFEVHFKVQLEIPENECESKSKSEYFRELTPWEDYVKLINEIRPYQIKSQVKQEKSENGHCLKVVELIFPNLM